MFVIIIEMHSINDFCTFFIERLWNQVKSYYFFDWNDSEVHQQLLCYNFHQYNQQKQHFHWKMKHNKSTHKKFVRESKLKWSQNIKLQDHTLNMQVFCIDSSL